MKQCKCGKEIEDKYLMCSKCYQEKTRYKEKTHEEKEYLKILTQMNWNLGMISKTLQQLISKEQLNEIKKQMKK